MGQPAASELEVIGQWPTSEGNHLALKARPGTGYASIWLLRSAAAPRRIGWAKHAEGAVALVQWETLWAEQTPDWKATQEAQITSLIGLWHTAVADTPTSTNPKEPLGTFDLDGFRFAVEPTGVEDQAVLGVINVAGTLTPVADLLHDQGRLCGFVCRPDWKATPADRKQRWRTESEAILARAH